MFSFLTSIRSSPRNLGALALGILVLGIAPPVASAAGSVVGNGTGFTLTGSDAPDDVTVYLGSPTTQIWFNSDVTISGPCEYLNDDSKNGVQCATSGVAAVLRLAGGDDSLRVYGSAPAATSVVADLGAGNDKLDADEAATVDGGPGDDTLQGGILGSILMGGDGNDELFGRQGNDQLRGGAGNDKLVGDRTDKIRGADVIDGGPGTDIVDDWWHDDAYSTTTVAVTLDGLANDGFDGEGDNVTAVEDVRPQAGVRYIGDDGPNIVTPAEVATAGSDIAGLGGPDQLTGSDRDDRIDGGAGDDRLQGGFGNDTITGGPGRDTIVADRDGRCNEMHCDLSPGSAMDTIFVRDGEADIVSCGPGEDRVVADPSDQVASDCETVERGSGGGGAGAGAGGGGAAAGAGAAPTVAGQATLTKLRHKGLKITVTGRKKGATVKVELRLGQTVVARGKAKAGRGGKANVRVKLTAKGRKIVRPNVDALTLTLVAGKQRTELPLAR